VTGRARNHPLFLVLGLLWLGACGTKAPAVTGVVVTATFPSGTDQLQIDVATKSGTEVLAPTLRPGAAGAPLASPQSVTIYLPDTLAGTEVVCTVRALAGGKLTGARGSGEPTLVEKRLVPVEIDVRGAVAGDASVDAADGGQADGPKADATTDASDGASVDGPKANGHLCANDDECESSLCIGGMCCASACSGECVACNIPGKEGICSPKANGTTAAGCVDQLAPSCGFDGKCDGNGACRRYEAGVGCKAAACSANGAALMPASACDGEGVCAAANAVECAPYVCDATGGAPACRTTCRAGSADCVAPAVCVNGSCGVTPKKADGAGCLQSSDCVSNHCADGVCCKTECTGTCVSCNQTGFLGTCRPVAAAKPDPHGVCVATSASSCGQSGLCNGAGACALFGTGTVCAAGTCNGRFLRGPKHCDGKGACVAVADVDCVDYRCDPETTACFTTCTLNRQCAPGRSCFQNSCQ
jgi:hypothetical protein